MHADDIPLWARQTAHRVGLFRKYPKLALAIAYSGRHQRRLRERHEGYVERVSDRVNAASIELSGVMWGLCEQLGPRRAVDLGSGFSSYVIRAWAEQHGAEPWSVDTSADWLARTREYLRGANVSSENLLLWDDFLAQAPGQFDLVLHDLGGMGMRASTLPMVLALIAPGGVVVLDDMHKDPYHPTVAQELARLGWLLFNLSWRTLDSLGRYAAMTVRPS